MTPEAPAPAPKSVPELTTFSMEQNAALAFGVDVAGEQQEAARTLEDAQSKESILRTIAAVNPDSKLPADDQSHLDLDYLVKEIAGDSESFNKFAAHVDGDAAKKALNLTPAERRHEVREIINRAEAQVKAIDAAKAKEANAQKSQEQRDAWTTDVEAGRTAKQEAARETAKLEAVSKLTLAGIKNMTVSELAEATGIKASEIHKNGKTSVLKYVDGAKAQLAQREADKKAGNLIHVKTPSAATQDSQSRLARGLRTAEGRTVATNEAATWAPPTVEATNNWLPPVVPAESEPSLGGWEDLGVQIDVMSPDVAAATVASEAVVADAEAIRAEAVATGVENPFAKAPASAEERKARTFLDADGMPVIGFKGQWEKVEGSEPVYHMGLDDIMAVKVLEGDESNWDNLVQTLRDAVKVDAELRGADVSEYLEAFEKYSHRKFKELKANQEAVEAVVDLPEEVPVKKTRRQRIKERIAGVFGRIYGGGEGRERGEHRKRNGLILGGLIVGGLVAAELIKHKATGDWNPTNLHRKVNSTLNHVTPTAGGVDQSTGTGAAANHGGNVDPTKVGTGGNQGGNIDPTKVGSGTTAGTGATAGGEVATTGTGGNHVGVSSDAISKAQAAVDRGRVTSVVAHDLTPGREVFTMQAAIDKYNAAKSTHFVLGPRNGTTQIFDGRHTINRKEMKLLDQIMVDMNKG